MTERTLDVICMGRAAVDLYGEQLGSRLEDMTSFAKYLGGSPANVAFGAARLGLKSAMLTRVGNEHMGRFVREELAGAGVDVSHVETDPQRLTGLVILGIKNQDTFPLIFYRENCADMALSVADVDEAFIASARALLVSGTHLSTESTRAACLAAVEHARRAGTRVVLDIDYRPVLWGLTGHGRGEERFVASQRVTEILREVMPRCDAVVGTEEEMHIAGGIKDTLAALRRLRELTTATLVVKRGALGCSAFAGAIPENWDISEVDAVTVAGFAVEVLNVLGAGDAFMAGFLKGWLSGEPLATSCRYGNACGALVVSRHGCAPAMPTWDELAAYLERADELRVPDRDPVVLRLHRVGARRKEWPELCVLAFDHRRQLVDMADELHVPHERIIELKVLIGRAVHKVAERRGISGQLGVIVDDRFGARVLADLTGTGLWLARPVEVPGSRPLQFADGDNMALALRTWPAEHVAKCLVFYHPDDSDKLRQKQERAVQNLFEACAATGRELLLEIIAPKDMPEDAETMSRAMENMYLAGVYPDWWKLPPPRVPEAWAHMQAVIRSCDPFCRGIVLLGQDAPLDELEAHFRLAGAQELCKGFAVGRSIFAAAARKWLAGAVDDESAVAEIADNYARLIDVWRRAAPRGGPGSGTSPVSGSDDPHPGRHRT